MEEQFETWTPFIGNAYIKGSDVKEETAEFVVEGMEIVEKDGKKQLVLHIFYEDMPFKFGLNVHNSVKLQELKLKPRELKGKVITVKKVLATNPKTRKEVEGLRIVKVVVKGDKTGDVVEEVVL